MITVILTCWKRFKHFEDIIKQWLNEDEVDEIIIWDNSGTYKLPILNTDKKIILLNCSENLGASVRYSLAGIAKNEILMFADDDVQIFKGFCKDLLNFYQEDRLIGIHGRNFKGSFESGFNNEVLSYQISEAQNVDFVVGFLMLLNRKYLLGINYHEFPKYCCEFRLQSEWKIRNYGIKTIVIPTLKWQNYPEQYDEFALANNPDAIKEKEFIYKNYYLKGVMIENG